MGTYGTATGVIYGANPTTGEGVVLSLKDGEVQASIVGDGITAANDNLVLDENGVIVHDLSNASITSPTLGVGVVSNRLGTVEVNPHEDFSVWTVVGTAAVTSNTVICPTGIETIADTIDLPAVNDAITCLTASSLGWTMTAGDVGTFSLWLKGSSAGLIQLTAATSTGTALADTAVAVTTDWRRVSLSFSNTTGGTIQVKVGILRATSGQMTSLYAWGAQVIFGYTRLTPYWPNRLKTPVAATAIRGPLLLSTANATFSIIIGTDWMDGIPSGIGVVAIGDSAGDGSTGDQGVFLGHNAGAASTAGETVALGEEAGFSDTGQASVWIGGRAGYEQSGLYSVGIGGNAGDGNTGDYGVFVGIAAGADNTGDNVVALGRQAGQGNTANSVIALGYNAGLNNTFQKVFLVGEGVAATANGQIVFGSNTLRYTHGFMGSGVSDSAPAAFTFGASGGLGTDIAGAALKLAGGRGTGTGVGGAVVLQTAPAGLTGASQNALVDRITVGQDGSIDFHGNTIANWAGPGGSTSRWRTWFGA